MFVFVRVSRSDTHSFSQAFFSNLAPHGVCGSSYTVAPMEPISPQELAFSLQCPHLDLSSWPAELANSASSSNYSGSPDQSDLALPVIAPQPQHIPGGSAFEIWHDIASVCQAPDAKTTLGQVRGLPVAVATEQDRQMQPFDLSIMFDPAFAF